MYFENVLFNILLILGIIVVFTLLNFFLNANARFFMKYSSSMKKSVKDLIDEYSIKEKMKLDSFPSKASNDLDNYLKSNNCIFINSRHYFSSSIYALARAVYFCSIAKVSKKETKKYQFQNKVDSLFTLLDVLAYGIIFIGLLLKISVLVIIGLVIITLSFICVIINLGIIKKYYEASIEYISQNIKDQKEIEAFKLLYKYEYYQYILRPLLAVSKLFPVLLSSNQKKENQVVNHYE